MYSFQLITESHSCVLSRSMPFYLDVLSKKYMTDWLSGQSDVLTGTDQLTVLRNVINECYVAICQYVGLVKAD